MKTKALLLVLLTMQPGCMALSQIEHSINGGISRSHSGTIIYAAEPSGSENQGGAWWVGTQIKTTWKVK